jgi:hypothetical protein
METAFDFIKLYHPRPKGAKVELGRLLSEIDNAEIGSMEIREKRIGDLFADTYTFKCRLWKTMRILYEEAIERYQNEYSQEKEEYLKNAWGFVVKYYPDYDHADSIAECNDLSKLLGNEINGYAEEMLYAEYDGDIKNPQIKADYNELHVDTYKRAIEAFIEKEEYLS